MDTLLRLETRVKLLSAADQPLTPRREGEVIGYSILGERIVYLVKLDYGFFTPEKDFYIETMVCDPSVVQPIA